jgi:RNA polymerase sigma-70 factor (ECF subfamily)
MSSPPNGRALPFPLLWRNGRAVALPALDKHESGSPSDEELMAWIQGKDHQALDQLYTRYSRLVFGIALRVLNDKSEAEEVVQEVFLAIYQKALQFDPGKGSGKTWLVQIAAPI